MSSMKKTLRDNYADFWKVFTGVRGGRISRGYYTWQDKDKKFRQKYMVCTPIAGTRFVVAATSYQDELTGSARKLEAGAELINDKAKMNTLGILGATLLLIGLIVFIGGHRLTDEPFDRGHFYAPTLLTGVGDGMKIYREETFGPVAPVITYGDVDDVLAMANDTNYGLAAYVYTRDLSTAIRAFEGLRFGIVGVNDVNPTAASAPFGGMKQSGNGREGGREGILEYVEAKYVSLELGK